jgi:RNA polymerase sigma factor (sigma-70 family)
MPTTSDIPIDQFRDLMGKIRHGSEDAAWELVSRYGHALQRAVRRTLNARLRPKFDSSDFVQLVWLSFFRIPATTGEFNCPAALVAYLVRMAQNKVLLENRRRLAPRHHNLNREFSLDSPPAEGQGGLADPSPAPVEVAIAREQWNHLMDGQPDHYRQIIELKLQGQSCEEIAELLQLAPSTVRRFLNRLLGKIAV